MGTRTFAYPLFGSTGQWFVAGVTIPSSAVSIEYGEGYSVQFNTISTSALVASSAYGQVSLLGSNDNINFTTINGSTANIAGGTSGTVMINVGQAFYKYMQAKFVPAAASSGFVNALMLSKAWGT